jgi:hypothetical protein
MRWFWCGAILVLTAVEAAASGALGCGAEDEASSFELAAGLTRGMGSPTFNFRGDLEILDQSVAEDLRKVSFEDRHLAQYWLDDEELRLLVFREREGEAAYGSVELTIRTKARGEDDTGSYEGTYEIEVYDLGQGGSGEGRTLTLTGEVSCFAE